ncbi:hypothetical protein [Saccharopolyspora griseoalba]|uniref:Uncharacterized protein n=1 Tax=Saccharopolyspora griseoalba TaxID=1431848 RepID=A0ABW2LPA1_9PSEU
MRCARYPEHSAGTAPASIPQPFGLRGRWSPPHRGQQAPRCGGIADRGVEVGHPAELAPSAVDELVGPAIVAIGGRSEPSLTASAEARAHLRAAQ